QIVAAGRSVPRWRLLCREAHHRSHPERTRRISTPAVLFFAPVTEAQAYPLGSFDSTALRMTGRRASQQSNPLADKSPAGG
ncbi:MAG: hypothetical protein AAGK21_16840, partial [Bacteroidota bacterium]